MKKLLIALAMVAGLGFAGSALAEDKPAEAPAAAAAMAAPAAEAPAAAPAAAPTPAEATPAAAPAPTPNKGDTTFMFISTVLVILMTIPGLALFYGGMVRSKNILSVLMQVFVIFALVAVIWAVYGYSLAFTAGGSLNSFVGGFDKVFLKGVTADSVVETFSKGVVIPEMVFAMFQLTFAAITPALIVGAFAERMKFSAVLVFIALWVTVVYFPIAHMVWFWGGPSAYADPAGFVFGKGALDFAGGTVVHINAGIAGLVGAILIGKRVGYGREPMPPHNLTMTMIGASLLWVGWFGFNVGSNLEANGVAGMALANTLLATAAATLSWMLAEWLAKGKPSMLGAASGAVAGLVAVTPAAGFAGPMGSIVLGLVAGVVCLWAVVWLKHKLGYDDALDVFGVHCVGGILGAIGTGILANPALGGSGVFDYAANKVADFDTTAQVISQFWGVGTTLVWSGVMSLVLYKLVDVVIGLRVPEESEREGLDVSDHGERAYS